MPLTIPAETFKRSFQTVVQFVPKRTTNDNLKYIRLGNRAGRTELMAGDGDSSIVHHMELPVQELPLEPFLLPAERFGQVLHESAAAEFSLSGSQGMLTIDADAGQFKLCTISEKDFPQATIPTGEPTASIKVAAKALRTALDLTNLATDPDSQRYALGGVKFEASKDKLILAATDSCRLSVVEIAAADGDTPMEGFILPALDVKRLISAAGALADSADVVIGKHPSKATFAMGNSLICCSELQGRFPEWRKVMPDKQKHVVTVPAGQLLGAIRAARLAREDKTTAGLDFEFRTGELQLSVSSETSKLAGKTKLPIGFDALATIKITIDPDYLVDWLCRIDQASSVEWKIQDGDSAQLLVAGDARYVVMPLSRD